MPPKNSTNTKKGKRLAKDWKERFLKGLEETSLVTEACKLADVSRITAYKHRKLDDDFAERWEEIIEADTEQLEQVAVRRAKDSSDTLLIFLLKSRRPHVYRDRYELQHTGKDGDKLTLADLFKTGGS